MRVSILAIGKNRQGVFKDLYQFYATRIQWEIQLIEVEVRGNFLQAEHYRTGLVTKSIMVPETFHF